MGGPELRRHNRRADSSGDAAGQDAQFCWLCGRSLATRVQQHHTVPKAKKGRATVPVHPICHRAIHANFTNAELARIGSDRTRLMENEQLQKFVAWVQDKPPDFHAPTR